MRWVLEKPDRYLLELAAISDLCTEVDWIENLNWRIALDTRLKIDVDLRVQDKAYDVELIYPELFPDTPPFVIPRSAEARWSSHQYGPGGTLCLEWGPDNWNPNVTGADIIQSAYRLLSAERNSEASNVEVPSRHAITFGQQIRTDTLRAVVTHELRVLADELGEGNTCRQIEIRQVFHSSSLVLVITDVADEADTMHPIADIPSGIKKNLPLFCTKGEGWLFSGKALDTRKAITDVDTLIAELHASGFEDFQFPPAGDTTQSDYYFLLIDLQKQFRFLEVDTRGTTPKVSQYSIIDEAAFLTDRLPPSERIAPEKRIGIVGLGSVGSKVAVSLARSGARKFLLVDDDVIHQGNLTRHELNWASVGVNKVNAVNEELSLIAPNMDVRIQNARIAGQESARYASSVLDALSGCDLLMDATANPSVFVQLSAVAKRRQIPLVWGEVFAGGIGALIARSWPGVDPDPLQVRAGIYNHLEALPEAPFKAAVDYDVVRDGTPIVAHDSEVGGLSSVVTRVGIDILLARKPPEFPYAAYLLGFKKEWIFSAPFDTRPIDILSAGSSADRDESSSESRRSALKSLADSLRQDNADSDDRA